MTKTNLAKNHIEHFSWQNLYPKLVTKSLKFIIYVCDILLLWVTAWCQYLLLSTSKSLKMQDRCSLINLTFLKKNWFSSNLSTLGSTMWESLVLLFTYQCGFSTRMRLQGRIQIMPDARRYMAECEIFCWYLSQSYSHNSYIDLENFQCIMHNLDAILRTSKNIYRGGQYRQKFFAQKFRRYWQIRRYWPPLYKINLQSVFMITCKS